MNDVKNVIFTLNVIFHILISGGQKVQIASIVSNASLSPVIFCHINSAKKKLSMWWTRVLLCFLLHHFAKYHKLSVCVWISVNGFMMKIYLWLTLKCQKPLRSSSVVWYGCHEWRPIIKLTSLYSFITFNNVIKNLSVTGTRKYPLVSGYIYCWRYTRSVLFFLFEKEFSFPFNDSSITTNCSSKSFCYCYAHLSQVIIPVSCYFI